MNFLIKTFMLRDFLSGPVAETLGSQYKGTRFEELDPTCHN